MTWLLWHDVHWCVFVVLQMSSDSQMKKLEEQLSEANRRGDDLQRTLTDLSVAKNRLTGTLMVDSLNLNSNQYSGRYTQS